MEQNQNPDSRLMLPPAIITGIEVRCMKNTGKFTVEALADNLALFIGEKLRRLNKGLHAYYEQHKNKIEPDTIKRALNKKEEHGIYLKTNAKLADLLCYYAFEMNLDETKREFELPDFEYRNPAKKSRGASSNRGEGQSRDEIQLEIGNRLLEYHKERVGIAMKSMDEFELQTGSFNDKELKILEQLQPLRDCLGIIEWDKIRQRLWVNKRIIRGLKIVTPFDDSLIVGFYGLYPITKEARDHIEQGTITKSGQFQLKHICKNASEASAIYISVVFAIDMYSKAILISRLLDELKNLMKLFPNIDVVYTRPVTPDGLRNVQRNNFTKLSVSGIYYTNTLLRDG